MMDSALFPFSHKTVIVLDRSPYFMKESSKHLVDFDVTPKTKGQGLVPLAPIAKTLWTCNVEAALEYVRVVYDIFPTNKLIEIVVSDTQAHVVNSWSQEEQSLQHIMGALGCLPSLAVDKPCNMMYGISAALEALCRPSRTQHQYRTAVVDGDVRPFTNRGRIVCLSSFKSDAAIQAIEQCVVDTIIECNRLAAGSDKLIALDGCELVLVDVSPIGKGTLVTPHPQKRLSSQLSCEVHSSQSGRNVTAKFLELVMRHFTLSSTTVTGIPMKEEQNASSSANYDVEMFHMADAHADILKSTAGHVEGLVVPSREGLFTETVSLKWCTPKSTAIELQHCTGAYRITPVDVNSRPSSCLTNFLLSGRSVMLEQPRKGGTRLVTHMLTSHGGEIYIHTLATSRSILEDPPSISEGAGGRVTDYRIQDFGQFMKDNRLAPVIEPTQLASFSGRPIDRAKLRLERMTRVWPMTISETIIFNMAALEPLPSIIVQDQLDDNDVLECKKVIYRMVAVEQHNEALPITASTIRSKGVKRDEQYRLMWAEFERLVRAHSSTSPNHVKVLECLLECKKPSGSLHSESANSIRSLASSDSTDGDRESDRYGKATDRKDVKVEIKQEIVEPSAAPAVKKFKFSLDSKNGSVGSQSLLALWTNRVNAINQARCKEFSGRLDAGPGKKAELYQHLNREENGTGSAQDGAEDNKNGTGNSKVKYCCE